MNGFTAKRIDELHAINHGAVKLAGDGQEEVYVVLAGSAELTVGGRRVEMEAGGLVRVEPAATRKLVPGPRGARVLAIGRAPGGGYERPDAFRVASRA